MGSHRREWDELEEWQRNCLMWPDFIEWDEPKEVTISRTNPTAKLGLDSLEIQDPETNEWYNITKSIKENSPIEGSVNRFEWISAVDGKSTTHHENDFTNYLANGKNEVRLSLRTAKNPLSSKKQWEGEKTVTLDLKEKKLGFNLVHFYSKKENEQLKDHILVWDIKPDTQTCELLYRGDELLEVKGESIGKKLAQVQEKIFRNVPGKVDLKFKNIKREDKEAKKLEQPMKVAVPCKYEKLVTSPESSTCGENVTGAHDNNATELLVVEKETDPTAEQKEQNKREIDPTSCSSRRSSSGTSAMNTASSSKKPVQEINPTPTVSHLVNEGFNSSNPSTPVTVRKKSEGSQTSDKMCTLCASKNEKLLPDNRDLWPIDKIEPSCMEKLCIALDLKNPALTSIFVLLDGFSAQETGRLTQHFIRTGGNGMAEAALGIWGRREGNNVGKLREKCSTRGDVKEELKKWDDLCVCHCCGRKLSDN